MMAVVESARALGCIIFSFVRHPYTRLSSLWYDRVRAPTWEEAYQVPKDSLYYPGQSVSEFIDRLNKIGVSSDIHTWPQISFLIDRGKIPLDFMGRCETIEEDWKKLQEFRSLPDLEKLNGRVDRPAVLLSKHDKEKIQNLYHQDFATFAFTS